jgi:hypothetical protein
VSKSRIALCPFFQLGEKKSARRTFLGCSRLFLRPKKAKKVYRNWSDAQAKASEWLFRGVNLALQTKKVSN